MRPILAWNPLPQVGHMRIGVVCRLLANLALCVSHFFSAASVVFGCMGSAMNEVAPGWTVGIEKALLNKQ